MNKMLKNNYEKQSFVMYDSFLSAMKHLNDAEFRECTLKIRDYALEDINEESESPNINIIMELVKPNLDASRRRYMASVENGKKGAEFGKLGGAPRGNQNARKKQPLNQPLDVNDYVDVKEDVNEEVNVNGDAPLGEITSHSSLSHSSIGHLEEIENDSERLKESEEKKEPMQGGGQYYSNDSRIGIRSNGKDKNILYSKQESLDSVQPNTRFDEKVGSSATYRQQNKEPGMNMSEYLMHLIKKDVICLAKMLCQGQEYDKAILNRAIDNLIALYGRHDRKSGYKEILSAVEQYAHNHP